MKYWKNFLEALANPPSVLFMASVVFVVSLLLMLMLAISPVLCLVALILAAIGCIIVNIKGK